MLYNLQGPRIHAVGIYGMGNIMQQPLHTLDFVSSYQAGNRWNLRLSVKNILDSKVLFTQQVKTTGEVVTGAGLSSNYVSLSGISFLAES